MRTKFFRVLDEGDKVAALRDIVRQDGGSDGRVFSRDPAIFAGIPNQPFCYWLPEQLLEAYLRCPAVDESYVVRSGSVTFDDFRFLRVAWEPNFRSSLRLWYPISKGGAFARFYADGHLVIDWMDDGNYVAETVYLRRPREGYGWGEKGRNKPYFGNPAITWSRRSQKGFSARVLPGGSSFSDKSPTVQHSQHDHLWYFLAVANSRVFSGFLEAQVAFGSYEIGAVGRSPLPAMDARARVLAELAYRGWSLKQSLDTRMENSHAFLLPALLQVDGTNLDGRAGAWAERVWAAETELAAIQAEIDKRCFDLYGIGEADRDAIGQGVASVAEESDEEEAEAEADAADDEGDVGADVDVDVGGLVAGLVAWAVGVAFGRFDVRLATGERELPGGPEPFDPLPVCSPGMLVGDDGLPLTSAPSEYPVDFPASGVLVDDLGDSRDLTAAVRAVFDRVFGPSADAFWDEAAELLDPRDHDLRAWLRSGFFELHLKLHSKSRRKAPILWQLGTSSARYSVWLYAHRLTNDSLFQLQNDVLAQKLAYEERQLANLVQSSGGSPSAKERREIEAQQAFVDELRVLREEVKRVAPLWKPTLDDGIVLVMAPLWRLVPHKPWQRELKKKWEDLRAGKYDWAQVAMHLWPERVVPKCAHDRSLAIAHGLEDVFWVEDDEDGKWQPRDELTTSIEELIQQRESTATRDALRGAD